MTTIRIGTRRSALALAQARQAGEGIARCFPGSEIEIVPIQTRGDQITGPLTDVGGKGLFTADLETKLRNGELDLAVHSAKDLPAEMPVDLVIAGVLPRADARDALLSRARTLEDLPPGAKVGTCSLRRAALLKEARGDLEILPLRGNVETRVKNVLADEADLDATVLALAGLERSGFLRTYSANIHPLPADAFVPAAGQGTLVLQARADNAELLGALDGINHRETHEALLAERAVLRALRASCHSCLAAHVFPASGAWQGRGMVACPDGADMLHVHTTGPTAQAVATDLAEQFHANGAEERLHGK